MTSKVDMLTATQDRATFHRRLHKKVEVFRYFLKTRNEH